jgi:hypothetical protein
MRGNLPGDIREELKQILAILAGNKTDTSELATRTSISRLPEADAKEAARRIVSLFNFAARSHPLRG